MNLTLVGHDYKYAVEQIMLMLYPDELPVYTPVDAERLSAVVTLKTGPKYTTATTEITADGKIYTGTARTQEQDPACKPDANRLAADRVFQKIIKRSFYKAAVLHTGAKPVWGALTGIRPGKIATALLESGCTEAEAIKKLEQEYFVSPARAALTLDTAKASLRVKGALQPGDIALYIGIPFCPSRCHYCSFVSHSVEKSMKLIPPFLQALYKEIDALSVIIRTLGLSVVSVYIGGGTPTTLSAEQLDALMGKLSDAFPLEGVQEFTVEAGRPETITPEKLAVFKKNTVTRASINPQSMSDAVLSAIGRKHTAADILTAFRQARETGIGDINMDLIAGLPGDTAETFSETLDTVVSLRPENITVHTLSLKKGTRITLEKDKTRLPDASEVAVMLDTAQMRLRESGYIPYYLYRQKFMSGGFENVGWCLPGHESLYNILIMEELTTILALGGGGVTKLVAPFSDGSGKIERIFNLKYPYEFVDRIDDVIKAKSRITDFFTAEGVITTR
jgi:oxygen-independent coproporphyrinogen-3 oxidase